MAILPALALGAVGCSGFRTSQSVSPATFLLPGIPRLIQTEPQPGGRQEPVQPAVPQVASVQ